LGCSKLKTPVYPVFFLFPSRGERARRAGNKERYKIPLPREGETRRVGRVYHERTTIPAQKEALVLATPPQAGNYGPRSGTAKMFHNTTIWCRFFFANCI